MIWNVGRNLIVVGIVVVMTSAVMAQPGGPGGGRRGGFGGGFGGGGAVGLLGMPEVQKELGLSEADASKLLEDLRSLRPERGEGGRGGGQNLTEEQRQARREEFRKQMEETTKKADEKIKSTLTEAQFKRLGELRLQREGVAAFNRSEIADKLKLTTEQKEKIAKIAEEGRPQFGGGRRGASGEDAGQQGERPNFEEMRARREKMNTEIVAVLTPEQKTAWENMKGTKFDFPAPNFGGEGGGRRGGRGNRPAAE